MSDKEEPQSKRFKKPRAVRKRRDSDEDSDSTDDQAQESGPANLDELKEIQKLRKRPKGISLAGLATGKVYSNAAAEVVDDTDPFKIKTGGYIDMKKKKKRLSAEEAIGTAFAAETNTRDEDAEMQKYVEQEILRRKGLNVNEEGENSKQKNDAESLLYQLPEHLDVQSSIMKTEDMLSNQMLSGIPEVDLGIAAKIRNIEATEEAKQKLMQERLKKKDESVSNFVPTNMAVNFVQHDRYKVDSSMLPQVKADKSKDEQILQKYKEKIARR